MAIATSHRFTDGDLPVEAGRYRLPPPPPPPPRRAPAGVADVMTMTGAR